MPAAPSAGEHHRGSLHIAASSVIPLICFTTIWITTSVGQVVLVKYFQLVLNPQLPWLLADLAGIGFVIVIPMYIFFCVKRVRYEKKERIGSSTLGDLFWAPYGTGRIKYHILGGLLTGFQLLCISFALKMLPGSTFTVVRGSELLITLSLSLFFFGKPYNMYHYLGVIAMISGGVMVSMATAEQEKVHREGINVAAGAAITFFGVAFTSCSQAVLVEWLYHHNVMVKKRYDHLMEISLYTTLWTAIVLIVGTYFFSGGEYHLWGTTISEAISASPVTTWLCLIGLTISRALAMTTKVGVTVHSDAMFNRSLTTIRRVCQISSMAILFHEHLSALALIGIFVSIAASSLYAAADFIHVMLGQRPLGLGGLLVVLVKYFQTNLHPQLPWLLADLAGVGFIFVIPFYIAFCLRRVKFEKEKEENPSTMMDLFMAPYRTGRIKWHILGGLFTGCQLLCISFALKMLPGSTFTVVRTCELLITLVSSIVLLGKVFNRFHYVAVAAMLIGGAIDSFATQHDDKVSKQDVQVVAGVLITFFGVALASSSQAVLVEWLYQHNIMVKKRYDHLMEISLYTTFYTCVALMLGTFLFSGDEPHYWYQALSDAIRAAPFTTWLCLIGLTMSRAVAMTSKGWCHGPLGRYVQQISHYTNLGARRSARLAAKEGATAPLLQENHVLGKAA
ncbi:conserved hypothetical protein [Perkinsus marinus ATCC 50983]|uniref:EamA domain-containing protein n=1 Tax=Perkinsus marinus (strain ATCC 50983 / TXsc) TaxID=423536 RepID=C5KV21_PERM5|nr:conserved hypothetical protein [Perkinsus marinus ATCC 50983]EER11736.1 conserved hypothetical protein [Perkinsus marinus ATCC 50983]|eukprot:XP_002779941.1 conserved hypothetical protein [Perkinsus marinus ATCC 50983]